MTHWTISRLKDYEVCPARHDYASNKQGLIQRAPMPAADRGTAIHESIEHYLQGNSSELHKEVSPVWRIQLQQLRDYHHAISEEMWELAEGWHPRGSEPLWLRAKIDAHFKRRKSSTLHLIDFKTGKPYVSNEEQLEVYAVMGFAMFDDIDTVQGSLWYLDSDVPYEKTFKRFAVPKLARKWEGRARPLLEATTFPHRPGKHCSWCPFRKECPQAA